MSAGLSMSAPRPLSLEEVRQIAVSAGIPAEKVDDLLGLGIVLRDDGRMRVTLRVERGAA